jgi:hypothetical protein
MKTKLTLLSIAVLSVFTFSSCDKMHEKRFSTTLQFDFVVDQQSGDAPYIVDLSGLVDVLEKNTDLASHKDDIKKFELVQIRYKIFEFYNDPSTTFNGYIGFSNKSMNEPSVSIALNDISLQAGMDSPNLVKLNFSSTDVDKIVQYFTDTKGLKLYLDGNLSQIPTKFTLQVSVDVDAIADVKK